VSLVFATHPERPDLRETEELWQQWPEFMIHDDTAATRWGLLYDRYGDFQFWGLDAATGDLVAKCNCVPVALDTGDLPDDGWREVLRRAMDDEVAPTLVSALQIQVARERQGEGLSAVCLAEMRRITESHGFADLVAPVRPTSKARYPLVPADRYAAWTREDGLPFDPWLRVHARAGARLVRVCHRSMHVPGTVAEWEEWTGMAFPESGTYVVQDALVPVEIDREADRGVYVEPNVWMHHRLA
jgi:GNAT superfamily N-acetyltransferase